MKRKLIPLLTLLALLCICSVANASWKKDGDYLYYYVEGVAQTGQQTISSRTYSFTAEGHLEGNGSIQYVFGQWAGEVTSSNPTSGYYYFIGNDNKIKTGWMTIQGEKYYFLSGTGRAAINGSAEIDGSKYCFDDKGHLVINSWYENYYGDKDGKILTGYQTLDNRKYFFYDNGMAAYGKVEVDGQYHYFGSDGIDFYNNTGAARRERHGWIVYAQKYLNYFDPVTGVMQTGQRTINGKNYTFNDKGDLNYAPPIVLKFGDKVFYGFDADARFLTDWQTIDGNRYYFNRRNSNSACIGKSEINGKSYYFDDEGRMQTNILIKQDIVDSEKKYLLYFSNDGVQATGWYTLNGKRCYFDGSPYPGRRAIDGNNYYFDANGVMQAECFVAEKMDNQDDLYYCFTNGILATGWLTSNGSTYFFDGDGKAYSGRKAIDGYYYYFDSGHVMLRDRLVTFKLNSYDIKESIFYFDSDGIQVTGWKTIGANTYYFSTEGAYTGKHTIENREYLFSDEGILQENAIPIRDPGLEGESVTVCIGENASQDYYTAGIMTAYGVFGNRIDKAVSSDPAIVSAVITGNGIMITNEGCFVGVTVSFTGHAAGNAIIDLYSGDSYVKYVPVNVTGHNLTKHDRVEATEEGEGTEEYWSCTVCGKLFSDAAGTIKINAPIPIGKLKPADKVVAFVTRCYEVIQGRSPDTGGLEYWVTKLKSRTKTAAEIVYGFITSNEFKAKNYSARQVIEILYRSMQGRESDEGGMAYWLGKVQSGGTYANLVNGFCTSTEFKNICASYGITPGSVADNGEPVPTSNADSTPVAPKTPDYAHARAFLFRCYQLMQKREADEEGMIYWIREIFKGKPAAEILYEFINSNEFRARHLSNREIAEILYLVALDRPSEEGGMAYWLNRFNRGDTMAAIVNGFCESNEFRKICAEYGIIPGAVKTSDNVKDVSTSARTEIGPAKESRQMNEAKLRDFVRRAYAAALGREPVEDETAYWAWQILQMKLAPGDVAKGILTSSEFKGRGIGGEELIRILYRVYANREADEAGLHFWLAKLEAGVSPEEIMDGFEASAEFKTIVRSFWE